MLVSCMGTAREVQSNNACQPTHARQPLNAGGQNTRFVANCYTLPATQAVRTT